MDTPQEHKQIKALFDQLLGMLKEGGTIRSNTPGESNLETAPNGDLTLGNLIIDYGEKDPGPEECVVIAFRRWLEHGATISRTNPDLPVLVLEPQSGEWMANVTVLFDPNNVPPGFSQTGPSFAPCITHTTIVVQALPDQ